MDGSRLHALRKAKGMTQAELADKLFVAHSAVGKWESLNMTPSDNTLIAIAELFGCSIDYLFGFKTKEPSIYEQDLLKEFKYLSDEKMRAMVGYIKILKGD